MKKSVAHIPAARAVSFINTPGRMKDIKIFILDDDELGNEITRSLFSFSGIHNFSFRRSGKEAIRYLDICQKKDDFPGIILVDLNLPGMDGFEFIDYYESNYKNYYPETGIIMLTNSIIVEDRLKAMINSSILDFWSKPLTQKNITELIDYYHKLQEG